MTASRVFLYFVIALLYMECCYAASLTEETPMRRQFCNSFGGCGHNRTESAQRMPALELLRPRQYGNDESLRAILDSVNAIGDLFRKIEMQMKHWAAYQAYYG